MKIGFIILLFLALCSIVARGDSCYTTATGNQVFTSCYDGKDLHTVLKTWTQNGAHTQAISSDMSIFSGSQYHYPSGYFSTWTGTGRWEDTSPEDLILFEY